MKKLTIEDPETKSADIVTENVQQFRTLFPEAFTEGKINFDVLRQLLGGQIDEKEEKYGLNWHGKRRARQIALTSSTGTLRPCPEDSLDWDSTQNLLLEGDNLEVLKLLQKTFAGKVRFIYIDPPYNTGKDFVYPDDFQDNIRNYLELTRQVGNEGRLTSNTESSGRLHTNWLNMMYPRLKLARNLLREDGVIFISIDDTEQANLIKLCDEVLGSENFVGVIVWQTATDNNPRQIAIEHEYVVCYARNKAIQDDWSMPSDKGQLIQSKYTALRAELGNTPLKIESALRAWIRAQIQSGETDLEGVSHYSYVDDRGVYYPGNSSNPRPGGYVFDIFHPRTHEVCAKPENGYRWPQVTFDDAAARGEVHWGDDHISVPKIKKRLETATQLLKSSYYEDNRASTQELIDIMGEKVFDNPKSPLLIRRLLGFTTGPNDIILDFFAGSGTTAHAVLNLNAIDNGHRRYLLVQFPEPLDPTVKEQRIAAKFCDTLGKPRNIAELTKERMRRVGKKTKDENPMLACDFGFRVFKLDSSNIVEWEPIRSDLPKTLEEAVVHLKTDRTEQDVLFELLLKLGLDLAVPIEQKTIAGRIVHSIGVGTLLVCLSESVNAKEVESLALGIVEWYEELDPAGETTVVFRDSAFADDVAKTNLTAILEQHGLANVRSL